jgi:hypothetical protein
MDNGKRRESSLGTVFAMLLSSALLLGNDGVLRGQEQPLDLKVKVGSAASQVLYPHLQVNLDEIGIKLG